MINCYKPERNEQNCWSTKYVDGERDNSGCVDATDELGSGRQGYYLVDTTTTTTSTSTTTTTRTRIRAPGLLLGWYAATRPPQHRKGHTSSYSDQVSITDVSDYLLLMTHKPYMTYRKKL